MAILPLFHPHPRFCGCLTAEPAERHRRPHRRMLLYRHNGSLPQHHFGCLPGDWAPDFPPASVPFIQQALSCITAPHSFLPGQPSGDKAGLQRLRRCAACSAANKPRKPFAYIPAGMALRSQHAFHETPSNRRVSMYSQPLLFPQSNCIRTVDPELCHLTALVSLSLEGNPLEFRCACCVQAPPCRSSCAAARTFCGAE